MSFEHNIAHIPHDLCAIFGLSLSNKLCKRQFVLLLVSDADRSYAFMRPSEMRLFLSIWFMVEELVYWSYTHGNVGNEKQVEIYRVILSVLGNDMFGHWEKNQALWAHTTPSLGLAVWMGCIPAADICPFSEVSWYSMNYSFPLFNLCFLALLSIKPGRPNLAQTLCSFILIIIFGGLCLVTLWW